MNKNINIPGRLHSVATDGQVAGANEIYDDEQQKFQGEINAELHDEMEDAKEVVDSFDDRVKAIEDLAEISIEGGEVQVANTAEEIVAGSGKIPTANALNERLTSSDYVDDEPDAGSEKLVKSGGVYNELALGAVYDVSAKNPTAGPNNDGKFESLSALLSDANLNSLIPTAVRKGGITIKFVQSSDNKYVQARCMAQNFTTDVTQWQSVDDEPTAGSDNLVKSSGVYDEKAKQQTFLQSAWIDEIYTSNTDNYLDVDNVIRGYRVEGNGALTKDAYGVISRLIYVGDVQGGNMTISNPTALPVTLRLVFFKSHHISTTERVDSFNISVTRTITVPTYAKYCIMNFRNSEWTDAKTVDYSGLKISKSGSAATQPFSPVYLGNAKDESTFGKIIATISDINTIVPQILSPVEDKLDLVRTQVPSIPNWSINRSTGVGLPLNQIYGSYSTNYLDINNVLCGVSTGNTSESYVFGSTCRMSRLIPVEGKTKMTISGIPQVSVDNLARNISVKFYLDAQFTRVGTNFNLAGWTERTVDIPSGAVYAVVGLCGNATPQEAAEFDYTTMKVSLSSEATTDVFQPKFIGYAEQIGGDNINDYRFVLANEKAETGKRFMPYSVGTPSTGITFNNQYQRVNILFFTDSHADDVNSLANVRDTIDFANSFGVQFDAIIHGGDAFTPTGVQTKVTVKESLCTPFFNELKRSTRPLIFAKGNHDLNDWDNIPANAFNDDDWSEMWYDFAETQYGIVRQTKASGKKSTWHYYDITSKKVRIICLDAQDTDKSVANQSGNVKYSGANSWYISDEQMQWLANTALNFTEEGWSVIVVLHQTMNANWNWYATSNNPAYEGSIFKMYNMLKAFNSHTSYVQEAYTFETDNFYNLSAMNVDFSFSNMERKPQIIAVLCGHEHYDRDVTPSQIGGPNIIWTMQGAPTDNYSDSRVARIVGTSTQNAFDLISIDTNHKKIRYVRYGAGKNCYGEGGDRFLPDGLSY